MIYQPCLYSYDWELIILEVQFDTDYPPLTFIEWTTGMMPFGVN